MPSGVKDTHAKTTRARLFMEGIEVPVISVRVSGGRGAPATAMVESIPSDHVHRLEPRTLVHIFFYDPDHTEKIGSGFGQFSPTSTGQSSTPNTVDPKRWKLLFCGELVAYAYRKSGNARVIQFQCQDMSSYWEACPLYFGKYETTDRRYKQHIYLGAAKVTKGRNDIDSTSELISILQGRPSTFSDRKGYSMSGVAGGVMNLMETVCGVYNRHGTAKRYSAKSDKKAIPNSLGINDFLTQAEMRLRISRMIGASPNDYTSDKFLRTRKWKSKKTGKEHNVSPFHRMFRRLLRSQSAILSYAQIMQLTLRQVHYELTSTVVPTYFPLDADDERLKYKIMALEPAKGSRAGKDNPKVTALADKIEGALEAVQKRYDHTTVGGGVYLGEDGRGIPTSAKDGTDIGLFESDTADLASGIRGDEALRGSGPKQKETLDAIFSATKTRAVYDDAKSIQDEVSEAVSPTEAASGPGATPEFDADYTKAAQTDIVAAAQAYAGAMGLVDQWGRRGIVKTNVDEVSGYAATYIDGGLGTHDEMAAKAATVGNPEDWTDPEMTYSSVENVLKKLKAADEAIKKVKKKRRRYVRTEVEVAIRDRLHCFLITPDIYMCPPPTCNVFFPEDYNSISFSRNFMAECTRLWLHGINPFGTKERRMYFAPNADVLGGSDLGAAKAAARVKNFLMPHEKFSGQLPAMEGIQDYDVMTTINKKLNPGDRGALGADPHMKRTANYFFFKKRFGPRTAQVQGRFNPYLVPGLPGLVLDPDAAAMADIGSTPTETVEWGELDDDGWMSPTSKTRRTASGIPTVGGTHYYGMLESITHVINQNGAFTSATFSHCRSHSEGLEMFGTKPNEDGEVPIFSKASWKKVRNRKAAGKNKYRFSLGQQGGLEPDNDRFKASFDASGVGIWKVKQKGAKQWLKAKAGVKFRGGKYRYVVRPANRPNSRAKAQELIAAGNSPASHPPCYVYLYQVDPDDTKLGAGLPFETICRPPWFSSAFFNENIGEKVYRQTIGCGSVVDATVLDPNLVRASAATAKKQPGSDGTHGDFYVTLASSAAKTLFKKDSSVYAGQDSASYWKLGVSESAPIDRELENQLLGQDEYDWATDPLFGTYAAGLGSRHDELGRTFQGSTVKIPNMALDSKNCFRAAEDLAHMYAVLVDSGATDIDSFITNYRGERSFANMEDIFGSHNDYVLELSSPDAGQERVLTSFNTGVLEEDAEAEGVKYGYHHYAFGEYTNLDKLVNEPLLPKGASEKSIARRKVNGSVDPRKARYQLVKNYVSDILVKRVRKV